MAEDDSSGSVAMSVGKAAIFALGTIAAVGIGFALLKPLIVAGMVAGAGFLGYRLMNGSQKRALEDGKRKALPSRSDFDSKWAELEAAERKLDREIRRNS